MNKTVEALPAATLILLRQNINGLHLFMMKRNPASDFAPGALVFPGGALEPEDDDWGGVLPCGSDQIPLLSLKIAAIRETFEESGILLAKKSGEDDCLTQTEMQAMSGFREQINKGVLSFRDFIKQNNLLLLVDGLYHCANWITPKLSPKRFDTHFFLAVMPDQCGIHDGAELVESFWLTPDKVVEYASTDEYRVVFVTEMNALRLSQFQTIEEAINATKSMRIEPVEASVDVRGDKVVLCIPESAGYGVTEREWRM